MMGDINGLVPRELEADRLGAAERARMARVAIADRAALQRQRERVRLSLVLVSRRHRSARAEGA